jgi:hypothetical protein
MFARLWMGRVDAACVKLYDFLDSSKHEIRLLRVLSGTFSSSIDCEFVKVSLDNRADNKALIYGEMPQIGYPSMSMASRSRLRPISSVRSNDRVAVHQEMHMHLVDALCINQSGKDDVGKHVAIMGRIHSSCSEFRIWLCPLGCESVVDCLDFNPPHTRNFVARRRRTTNDEPIFQVHRGP